MHPLRAFLPNAPENMSFHPDRVRRQDMLYTIALVLLILWVLGLVTSFTAGGLLHILLVAAIVVFVFQLVTGRRGV
jgi:hypothetical protein